jgi:hypothetical protein
LAPGLAPFDQTIERALRIGNMPPALRQYYG